MSYILEALRRADAERQRGAVPGLHARTSGSTDAAGLPLADGLHRAGLRQRWLLRALIAVAALLALAAAWWLGQGSVHDAPPPGVAPRAGAGPVRVPAQMPAQMPPSLLPALQPSAVVLQQPNTALDGPRLVLPGAPLPTPAPAVGSPHPMPLNPTPPAALPPLVGAAPAANQAAAASAPEPLLAWAAVPEATRASLPRLAWSGVVYAEQPAQRLVVVNSQVAREGDEIAPSLRLEQIRPRSVVLRWRGQRFEMPL